MLGTDATDVEDHVSAAALEPVDKQLTAGGAAPHGASHRDLAHEHDRGRGFCDGYAVDVYVALAARQGEMWGQGGRDGWGWQALLSVDADDKSGCGTYLYRTPICRMMRSSRSLASSRRELR